MRSAMLPSASRNSRSRIMRPVTLSPSVPASGLSFTRNVIASVGGSIGWGGGGWGAAGWAGEGGHLGGAPGFHETAIAGEHFYVLTRLDRARRDAAGENAAEIGVGFK